jgi:sulfotransferase family protein
MQTAHVITFHKCGSNWFRRLFRDAAMTHGANITVAQPNADPINTPVDTGSERTLALYRTDTAETVMAGAAETDPVILCLRDPKDVLVSQYFSWKKTHENNSQIILKARAKLNELSQKRGQRYLVQKRLVPYCRAAGTWLPQIKAGRVILLKYEDLLSDFAGAMGPALAAAGFPLDAAGLAELEAKYSFSSVTRRAPGTEDTSNHYRKGIAGDWQNHFDARLSVLFDDRYGPLCDALGYARPEQDHVPTEPAEMPQDNPSEIIVVGFPKCGTTALMKALEADDRVTVLRAPGGSPEIAWPMIRDIAPAPEPGKILAHKFTAYIYNREALFHLRDAHPGGHIVLCIRDPKRALVSWHNMHRRIATEGRDTNHFAWKERDFYAECSLADYYQTYARPRLCYDAYLLDLLAIFPAERLTVLSQDALARNMDNITATLKKTARGTLLPIPEAEAGAEDTAHQGYADTALTPLPDQIDSELYRVQHRLQRIISMRNLHASL